MFANYTLKRLNRKLCLGCGYKVTRHISRRSRSMLVAPFLMGSSTSTVFKPLKTNFSRLINPSDYGSAKTGFCFAESSLQDLKSCALCPAHCLVSFVKVLVGKVHNMGMFCEDRPSMIYAVYTGNNFGISPRVCSSIPSKLFKGWIKK